MAKTENEAVKLAEEIGYPDRAETLFRNHHAQDRRGRRAVEPQGRSRRPKRAFKAIKTACTEKAGAQHFQGVTVQKMIKLGEGYEIILGSSIDPQFGPVLLFGMGGQLVEVFKDKALGLPPLNTTLARRMMETTKIYHALKGVRGRKSVDLAALEKLMVGFSQLVAEQRWIKEIDINPLFASADDLVALDARVILHDPKTTEDKLPRLAIRPYPTQYVAPWKLKDGTPVTIRPIQPEDEPLLVKFHETLSEESVYHRYFTPVETRPAHRARTADAHLLQRLRPRDCARRRTQGSRRPAAGNPRRGPVEQGARPERGRIRAARQRPLAETGPGQPNCSSASWTSGGTKSSRASRPTSWPTTTPCSTSARQVGFKLTAGADGRDYTAEYVY